MNEFPCTGCGLCCTKVKIAVENARKMIKDGHTDSYVKEVADFPYRTIDNGSCEHLLADHSCAVYESRPDICSVAKTFEKHHAATIPRNAYYASTAELCNEMMSENNTADNFFINLESIQ